MKLSNNTITIEVAEHGAELISLQKGGREYLWTGDISKRQYIHRLAPKERCTFINTVEVY